MLEGKGEYFITETSRNSQLGNIRIGDKEETGEGGENTTHAGSNRLLSNFKLIAIRWGRTH